MAFESPFEKGGTRGICLGTPWENPPSPPFRKGGILFTDKLLANHSNDPTLKLDNIHAPLSGDLSPSMGVDQKRPPLRRPLLLQKSAEPRAFSESAPGLRPVLPGYGGRVPHQ